MRRAIPTFSLSIKGVFGLFILLHCLLLINDYLRPEAMFAGDRVTGRLEKVELVSETLSTGGAIIPILVEKGDPGDFMYHALLYSVGGKWTVFVAQILLLGIAGLFLYKMVLLLFGSVQIATSTALIYFLLPGSIMHPHSLVTEGMVDPLIIIYTYFLLKLFSDERFGIGRFVLVGLMATVITSLRLIYLFQPMLMFILLIWNRSSVRLPYALLFLVLSFALPAIWVGMHYSATGVASYGHSDHALSSNIKTRLERMKSFDTSVNADRVQDTGLILKLIEQSLSHPAAFLKSAASDMVNYTFNSGVNTVVGRYLGMYEMPSNRMYFHKIRDEKGSVAMVVEIFKQSPGMAIWNVVFGIGWVLFIIISIIGLVLFARLKAINGYHRFILLSFPVYVTVLSLSAGGIRWDFRTPIEFILCIGLMVFFYRGDLAALKFYGHPQEGLVNK